MLKGSTPITNGAQIVTVTFPVVQESAPPVILTTVRNYSADDPKLIIESNPIAATAEGFTAGLGAPVDTGNYVLDWVAGTAEQVMQALSGYPGRKLSTYNAVDNILGAEFQIPVLLSRPRPALKLLGQDTFWSAVVQRAPVPASAVAGHADGAGLSIAADSQWLYVGNGVVWGRVPIDTSTSWGAQPFFVPFREKEVTLEAVAEALSYRIDFDTPFPAGQAPKVMVTLSDVVSSAKTLLGFQVIATDIDGFDIMFNSPLEHNNLRVYYMARQLPA